jgi:hypothetical protein
VRTVLLAAACGASLGCGALRAFDFSRGTLDIVSSRAIPRQVAVEYHPRVEGRACFRQSETGNNGVELAIADALAKRPEADALTLVTLRVESPCYIVEGTPVRLK